MVQDATGDELLVDVADEGDMPRIHGAVADTEVCIRWPITADLHHRADPLRAWRSESCLQCVIYTGDSARHRSDWPKNLRSLQLDTAKENAAAASATPEGVATPQLVWTAIVEDRPVDALVVKPG